MSVFKTFELHQQNGLKEIIFGQSASKTKAIAELAMNAADAMCSKVFINYNSKGFMVSDDGHGFKSEQFIDDFFKVFCAPHKEENQPVYGRFRIGRGQIMALAKVEWRSNAFSMLVDLHDTDKDAGYTFTSGHEQVDGTEVSGTLLDVN
jgi:hypothetical protein